MDARGRHAALILMLLATAPAAAQSVGDIADVQAKTLLFRAQAAQAEAAAKLAEANRRGGDGAYDANNDGLPVVRGVFGSGGKLYATFLYSNGSTVEASAGDTIPGGYKLRSLSASRVVLARNGKTFPVGFSDVRPSVPPKDRDQGASAGGMFLPPVSVPPPPLPN